VGRYLELLHRRDFALLWSGATVSTLGDGMTLVALVWLVLERTGSAAAVGALTVAYSTPVIGGGLVAGVLLDRFDRRVVMAIDTLGRGLLMASVPLLEAMGGVPTWWLFVIAASYGLLKMVPLAGVPALIPSLVEGDDLTTANAMESISYGVGGILGPDRPGVRFGRLSAADGRGRLSRVWSGPAAGRRDPLPDCRRWPSCTRYPSDFGTCPSTPSGTRRCDRP